MEALVCKNKHKIKDRTVIKFIDIYQKKYAFISDLIL